IIKISSLSSHGALPIYGLRLLLLYDSLRAPTNSISISSKRSIAVPYVLNTCTLGFFGNREDTFWARSMPLPTATMSIPFLNSLRSEEHTFEFQSLETPV